MTKRLITAAIMLCLGPVLGSCGGASENGFSAYVADHWPHWAGGMPADVPPRPGDPGYAEFIAHGSVHCIAPRSIHRRPAQLRHDLSTKHLPSFAQLLSFRATIEGRQEMPSANLTALRDCLFCHAVRCAGDEFITADGERVRRWRIEHPAFRGGQAWIGEQARARLLFPNTRCRAYRRIIRSDRYLTA